MAGSMALLPIVEIIGASLLPGRAEMRLCRADTITRATGWAIDLRLQYPLDPDVISPSLLAKRRQYGGNIWLF